MVAAADFDEAFEIIQFCNNHLETQSIESVFIIGGGDIYQQAIKFDNCKKIYITHILADFQCDTFFPEYQTQYKLVTKSDPFKEVNYKLYFAEYVKRP